ncbi:MAG TPA: Gfo/Idh/MocA family oxidoreductase [Oscillospiraceae bacterium]|nr:Gfo/Idh/MocA family oxidoreductase [Oscillospiraceae bacterium]HPF56064.1 Gfo/Idh/MocA family oxidoreductase [Clostridiales bacterium]HPK36140.1 Gfo/Idh/MocA family oxidoreductase [Oscillospiraceae bacterium]HPR76711.1 Gfo/Idh/MocA family oxidoreductase [Oscillospiraceae bacterium]
MEKLKIGVFGGRRGQTMIDVLLRHPDAELVAVCDKFPHLLGKVREKDPKVACYSDFESFIEHDMDAVVLANYANEHAVYAVKCLEHGLHVLSEVLPCETMAQAVALIEAVEKSGKVYAYAENYCYMKHAFEMWKRYQNGDIGEIMYGEGEYIHDCSGIWPQITYGERSHWRNNMHPNFYCTHSLGPLLTISGLRPVKVVGFEMPPEKCMLELGAWHGAGMELVTLENGAVVKSIHGGLKREPSSVNYEIYGQKGMMESGRFKTQPPVNVYREGEELCKGEWENYDPEQTIAGDAAKNFTGHGGSDFYATHFFIEKILGRSDGKWSIDVYKAVDMGICGLLGYRSVLNGNTPVDVPDLRDPKQRDQWRNDNACTNPAVAGDQLLPRSSYGEPEIPDEVYERVKNTWLEGLKN